MSDSDVFTVISEFVSQTLDKEGEARDFALDISKAIDRLWYAGSCHTLKCYDVGYLT